MPRLVRRPGFVKDEETSVTDESAGGLAEVGVVDEMHNVIHCSDARRMAEVADATVQLAVTSPPYNVGKSYRDHDDSLPLDKYLQLLCDVWRECYRVLESGGRLAINVANTDRKPYLSLVSMIDECLRTMEGCHWLHRGHLIWDKGPSVGVSTAWGSFARASNPVLRDVHEYITVWSKEDLALPSSRGRTSGILNQDFVDWTRSIWRFPTARRAGHPAPFPVELPRRLILLYTSPGDCVLDPFLGSGSTALAALQTGRRYIGYEISAEYCELAVKRLAEVAGGAGETDDQI